VAFIGPGLRRQTRKGRGFRRGASPGTVERWNRVRSFCKKVVVWRPMRWKFRWQGSPLFLARVPLARVETRERLSCNACYGKRLRAKRCRGTHWHDGDPCQARKLARVGDGLHARVDGLPRLIGPIGTALPFVKWSCRTVVLKKIHAIRPSKDQRGPLGLSTLKLPVAYLLLGNPPTRCIHSCHRVLPGRIVYHFREVLP
jgi:hypothetical protein